jgi:hypothetical protein
VACRYGRPSGALSTGVFPDTDGAVSGNLIGDETLNIAATTEAAADTHFDDLLRNNFAVRMFVWPAATAEKGVGITHVPCPVTREHGLS